MKLVIVGGVAGGASAAARARRLSEDAEIVVLERGPDVSFANCGLPYYVGGEIAPRDKLLVTTPQRLRERFRLDVRTRSSVEAIDRQGKKVRVKELDTGREYEETYDALILAPGAAPLRPPIPGIESPHVLTLRNLGDVDRIKSHVDAGAKRVVVVGAGFIGLELAENFVKRGVETTVVELQTQVLPPLDPEMTVPIVEALTSRGVRVILDDSADAFAPADDGVSVTLKSGGVLAADLVILGVGVRPENGLAVAAGLEVGPRGGIRVSDTMQTSDPAIWAVGDAVEIRDVVTGAAAQVPLAGPANRQGRIAAAAILRNAARTPNRYRGTQGTAIVGVFDRVAAITGASEKVLARAATPYRKVYVHPADHAGYYPGAEQMSLKLLFAPDTGRVLGVQAVGGKGVDKRIDVIAVAIQAGMTVFDLEEMELCYAPQFGSAKDPVNMAGFVAAGLVRGDHPQADMTTALDGPPDDGTILLDVRTPQEFSEGHLPRAQNIPLDDLRNRLAELPRDRRILAYCQVGMRGYIATRILLQKGFDVANLGGGYKTSLLLRAARPQG
ncbi:MAG: CoA-disulfide reductase [Planctomycetota bacterium]|nr:MAG: CoA-disulfide reductase [Planctomycetota bacterium]